MSITKAVFPVGGLGTRFLPATKAMPKEMLTLVDKPLIQYCIEEAKQAGITDVIFVTGRGKRAIEDHFDISFELEHILSSKGKKKIRDELRKIHELANFSYVRQGEPLGLGHAILSARNLVGNEPFAVILGDDIIQSKVPCLKQMVNAYEVAGGGCMMAVMDVPESQISSYGVLKVDEDQGDLVRAAGLVEKPTPEAAPSNVAVIGRYILTTEVLKSLGQMKQGAGGEIQLTDAIADQIGTGLPVHGYRFRGHRYDCGSKAGFLRATVAFALAREDISEDFAGYICQLAREDLAVGW
jgi:UTP--glucose-1-phosphate uridylyltransferase